MKKIGFLFSIALASSAINAQTPLLLDSTRKVMQLQDVIVTSNRLELTKKQMPQKLDIITQKDIEMNPTMDIGEIIKKMGALDVIQRPGVATYATIRGFRPPVEPGKINPEVTVLINGRPSGTQNLALFNPQSVERIEVLKGSAGAIYGSSAMGGVINIITKQNKGKVKGNVFGSYGSFKTAEMGYAVGGNLTEKLDFNFSGVFFERNQGFKFGKGNFFRKLLGSEQVELFPTTGPNANKTVMEFDTAFDGQTRNGTKMRYRSNSLSVGYQVLKNWRIELSGHSFSGPGIESSGDLRNLDAQQGFANRYFNTGDVAIRGTMGKHKISALYYGMEEENSTFNNWNGTTVIAPVPTYQRGENIMKWKGWQLQDVISFNSNIKFIAGADYNVASSRARGFAQGTAAQGFPVTERSPSTPFSSVRTFAPFAQAHITTLKGKLIVNPSIRYDFINFEIEPTPLFINLTPKKESNQFFSPSLGLQYNINKDWAVHSNIGRAFRFAQAFEIAGYFEEFLAGNKVRISTGTSGLKNEESVTGDIGVKYSNARKGIAFDITYYTTDVKNRIRQEPDLTKVGQIHTDGRIIDRFLYYTNADNAKMQGLEIEGSYNFGASKNNKYGLTIFANASHIIQAEDITSGKGIVPDAVVRVRNVAPLNVGYGIEYDNLKFISVRLSGRYMSKRYAQDFSNRDPFLRGAFMEFPKYNTLDLTVNYTVAKQHVLSLRVSNLTDENYYESRGFNLQGRNTSLRYTYRF